MGSVAPCPWQGCSWHSKDSEPALVVHPLDADDDYRDGDDTWVVCGDPECETSGPIATSEAQAWERWAELPRSPDPTVVRLLKMLVDWLVENPTEGSSPDRTALSERCHGVLKEASEWLASLLPGDEG